MSCNIKLVICSFNKKKIEEILLSIPKTISIFSADGSLAISMRDAGILSKLMYENSVYEALPDFEENRDVKEMFIL